MTRIVLDESHYITDRGFVFLNGAIRESELEKAPAEGWKPLCFDENAMAGEEYCDGVHKTNWMGYVQPELEENCRNCIYLKKNMMNREG